MRWEYRVYKIIRLIVHVIETNATHSAASWIEFPNASTRKIGTGLILMSWFV
jgi:hypothetical protein